MKALDSDGDGKISYEDFVLQFDALSSGIKPDEDLETATVEPLDDDGGEPYVSRMPYFDLSLFRV